MSSRSYGLAAMVLVLAACGPGEGPNRLPVVTGSPQTTPEDTAVTATVTASDPDGDRLEFRYAAPAHGTVTGAGASFTYQPAANFVGVDTVTVTVADGEALATATITIDVTPVPDPPTAVADTVAGQEDTVTTVALATLTANDVDVDGDSLTVTQVGTATDGAVAIVGTDVQFTPTAGFIGDATFRYTVSDGALTAMATVTVQVGAVNDPPVAIDDTATVAEDVALVVTAAQLTSNDTDVEGQALGVAAVGDAVHGTVALVGGTVTFTPALDYNGPASFSYTVSDGVDSDVGAVAITVTPVADAPVAVDDTVTATEDTARTLPAATLAANDTDPDGDAITVSAVSGATGGTVTLAGGVITFTPAPNLSGLAGFDYTATDGARTDLGHVTVTVAPVPDAPIAGDDTAITAEDTPFTVATTVLTANDADVDGPAMTVTAVAAATHGAVALSGGNVTFTPDPDFTGLATFEYTVSDGALTDVGLVTVTVSPVNDAPVAVDDTGTTAEDTAVTVPATLLTLNDTDVDGPSKTVTAARNASHGTVTLVSGTITFTPEPDFTGTASFDYIVSDGALSDVGLVTVTITPVNDAPVAIGGVASTSENTPVVLTLSGTDVDSPSLTFTPGAPSQGSIGAVTSTGPLSATVQYTPPINFAGPVTLTFTASDGALTSAVATLDINVVNVPVCNDGLVEAPETCDDLGTTGGDGCSPTCQVETGWTCGGAPSLCDEVCGDSLLVGAEECDDGNLIGTDGCTASCVIAPRCDVARFPAGDRFASHPTTGACYVGFDDDLDSQAAAQTACAADGGHLATITSALEQGLVTAAANDAQTPWIGASDDGNDTDAVFAWVTGEPWGFTAFASGQPDDDASLGGTGECLHLLNAAGQWNDTNCAATGFVVGRVCEYEPQCGDGVVQSARGETCDDGNLVGFDGCSAVCEAETLFFSEYIEGATGTNKAIEIANPFLTPRSLVGCTLRLYANGASTVSQSVALTQTIAAGDVLVICHGSSVAPILAQCDLISSSVANWNGDDAIELNCGGQTIDSIGQIGFDPGTEWGSAPVSTANQSLRRKCTVTAGDVDGRDLFTPVTEWGSLGTDVFTDLGTRSCSP